MDFGVWLAPPKGAAWANHPGFFRAGFPSGRTAGSRLDSTGAAQALGIAKALDVSSRNRSALVIGADTIVSLDGMVLGKPRDEEDAMDMLRALSGRTHLVYTGVAFCCGGQALSSFVQCTEVDFYPLTEEQIQRYLATGEPFDKAGAYGIQGKGGLFVKGIRGDYFNVVGFPLARAAQEMERLLGADGLKNKPKNEKTHAFFSVRFCAQVVGSIDPTCR